MLAQVVDLDAAEVEPSADVLHHEGGQSTGGLHGVLEHDRIRQAVHLRVDQVRDQAPCQEGFSREEVEGERAVLLSDVLHGAGVVHDAIGGDGPA